MAKVSNSAQSVPQFEDLRNTILQKVDFYALNEAMHYVPEGKTKADTIRACQDYVNRDENLKEDIVKGRWVKPNFVPLCILGKFEHKPCIPGVYEERLIDKESNTYAFGTQRTVRFNFDKDKNLVMKVQDCAYYQSFEVFAQARESVFGSRLTREECAQLWNTGVCVHQIPSDSKSKLAGKKFLCQFEESTGRVVSADFEYIKKALDKKMEENKLWGLQLDDSAKNALICGQVLNCTDRYGNSFNLQCHIDDRFINFSKDMPIETKASRYGYVEIQDMSKGEGQSQARAQEQGYGNGVQ